MLCKLLQSGFADGKDLSCSETILSGANKAYDLGLDRRALKLASGFGGGMGVESVCGALTGAVMALGLLYVDERAHRSPWLKEIVQEFLEAYEAKMGSTMCDALKEKYRTEEEGCRDVIEQAALVLDRIVSKHEDRRRL